jgi:transcriptional regulator with XRE-family HTH domain
VHGLNPLRRARQARGLTLQDVSDRTKLSPRLLLKIEMGEFGALPPGVQGRAHIRAYAAAVGLDADEVLRGLADRLPAAPDPVQSLRERERERFAEAHPVAAAIREQAEGWQRQAVDLARQPPASPAGRGAHWPYALAGRLDALIVALGGGVMLLGAAAITGAAVGDVWQAASWPLVTACLLLAVLYLALARRLGGRTPGAVLAGRLAPSRADSDPAMLPRSIDGSTR